jgi:hypothetical protein
LLDKHKGGLAQGFCVVIQRTADPQDVVAAPVPVGLSDL